METCDKRKFTVILYVHSRDSSDLTHCENVIRISHVLATSRDEAIKLAAEGSSWVQPIAVFAGHLTEV